MQSEAELPVAPEAPGANPFTSRHTSNFPALLRDCGISLLVSTYQAGKLIMVRAEGERLNTHFRSFDRPMGLAYDADRDRLAVGASNQVWEFRNQPRVAPKLPPEGRHDAAFIPRTSHHSGDIRIHELGWIGGEVWAVNTRFSCLSTFDREHSFVPRWRPPFVTALAPEDRCHLNGMAIADGRVRYATCFALTDTDAGWRPDKARGGALLEVPSGEPVLRGLSMPHSPRVYADRVWVLESGVGALSAVDLAAGRAVEVARMPGFTRGLDFHGHFAFVGLSQVRESAIFSGIPLVDAIPERTCGVWVIDIRTGQTVAFLSFHGTVQEIFAVQVLPGIRYPDVINEPGPFLNSSFVLPGDALRDVPGLGG